MNLQRIHQGFGPVLSPVVRTLLLINGAVYLLQVLTSGHGLIEGRLALWPDQVFHHGAVWQLITYMFLHGSLLHLLFNLFTLWMFGSDVERGLGQKRFLGFYLITGVCAALFHLLFNAHSVHPVLGASGAIYGVLVAFALLYPEREITLLLFFILPVHLKAKYLAAIFMAISLIAGLQSQITGADEGIAHLAHLGGGLAGWLLLRGSAAVHSFLFEYHKRRQWRRMGKQRQRERQLTAQRRQVDELLDKINQVGYANLTEQEKSVLKKAAERLSNDT